MIWFSFKKKKEKLLISDDTRKRILEESNRLGKPQILLIEIKRNQDGLGSVFVGFSDKNSSETGEYRFLNKDDETLLSHGELKFESGKFYFYPNIDLEWKKTSHTNIHKLVANYEFSKEPIYLEAEDFFRLRPILYECFRREGVQSLYFKGNLCQLEIAYLTKEKEELISEDLLTYLSSLYSTPWKE
ncbi:hypothetical protein EHQ94_05205 [Leptospira meyeri]|uniref:hypothetical protein n=1 Tax=Leptospira meyeri TaxID=29508 RepID=UPI0010849089|nr:hypothetical protein [Leptospira meyeri]TGM62297.1 hypothetical protein EHQ93_13390 [Leptospira meyeri]TGM71399.1 hypothetical protein EHQ94_05205 [Leptospira meyeri]